MQSCVSVVKIFGSSGVSVGKKALIWAAGLRVDSPWISPRHPWRGDRVDNPWNVRASHTTGYSTLIHRLTTLRRERMDAIG